MKLSDFRIGRLAFDPPDKNRMFSRWRSGELNARVFVSDDLFEIFVSALSANRKPVLLDLDLYSDKEGVLEYAASGLDTSKVVWKLDSEGEPSSIYIGEINITAPLQWSFLDYMRAFF